MVWRVFFSKHKPDIIIRWSYFFQTYFIDGFLNLSHLCPFHVCKDKEETAQWVAAPATIKAILEGCMSRVSSLKRSCLVIHHKTMYEGTLERVSWWRFVEPFFLGLASFSSWISTLFELAIHSILRWWWKWCLTFTAKCTSRCIVSQTIQQLWHMHVARWKTNLLRTGSFKKMC